MSPIYPTYNTPCFDGLVLLLVWPPTASLFSLPRSLLVFLFGAGAKERKELRLRRTEEGLLA
jgi:hypothetical protein